MKYYGITDTQEIIVLGDFDDFNGASDAADDVGGVVWIYDRVSLVEFKASINAALLATSDTKPSEEVAATEDPDMRPRAAELGLKHVWHGRYRGEAGEVTLGFAGGPTTGIHVTAFTEFGGRRSALAQVMQVMSKARELGYDAWCCDNNPNSGGYIAPKE